MFNLLEQKFYQFYSARIITIVLARERHQFLSLTTRIQSKPSHLISLS